jgi:hypothetical protein
MITRSPDGSRNMRVLLATAGIVVTACGPNPYQAKVEDILLADADEVVPVEPRDAPLVKLSLADLEPEIPEAPAARLAIARDVSWERVQTTLAAMRAKGVRPVILVGRRSEVHAFVLSEAIGEHSIHLTSTPDGKFCVGPPTTFEAKCVQGADKKHVQRAFVRETIRDAVNAYGITEVDAVVTPDLEWADVVKTIDGARTCCGDTDVKVKLVGAEEL